MQPKSEICARVFHVIYPVTQAIWAQFNIMQIICYGLISSCWYRVLTNAIAGLPPKWSHINMCCNADFYLFHCYVVFQFFSLPEGWVLCCWGTQEVMVHVQFSLTRVASFVLVKFYMSHCLISILLSKEGSQSSVFPLQIVCSSIKWQVWLLIQLRLSRFEND